MSQTAGQVKTEAPLLVPLPALVVEFLFAGPSRAACAADAIEQKRLWKDVLDLARRWQVLPQIAARIQDQQVRLAQRELALSRRDLLQVYGRNSLRVVHAIRAIQAIENEGIAVAAFKGIASMTELYPDPRHRTVHDADLLVSPRDLRSAIQCLERIGFTRAGPDSLEQYIQFVENSPGFAGNKAVALCQDGVEIDLHWELRGSGLDADAILREAVRVPLTGTSIPVAGSVQSMLLTARHAIRENLAAERVCRDLIDFRLRCDRLAKADLLEIAMRRAKDSGSLVSVLALLNILNSYDETSATRQATALLRSLGSREDIRSSLHLTELFTYQLHHEPLGKDVFYLVHAQPWKQIVRGLGTGWTSYRSNMRTFEERLDGEQPLMSRLASLARSLPGLREMKMARELARIKYGAY